MGPKRTALVHTRIGNGLLHAESLTLTLADVPVHLRSARQRCEAADAYFATGYVALA